MADLKGVKYTTAYVDQEKISSKYRSGKKRVIMDEYDGAFAEDDVILCGRLPRNAIVTGGFVLTEALGASTTLAMGNRSASNSADDDVDRYLAAASSASAVKLDLLAIGVIDANPYENDSEEDDCEIVITTAGALGTGRIIWVIEYVIE